MKKNYHLFTFCISFHERKRVCDIKRLGSKIRHRCHGSAELFGFGHWRFCSAESWFGRKYRNKIRSTTTCSPLNNASFGTFCVQIGKFSSHTEYLKSQESPCFASILLQKGQNIAFDLAFKDPVQSQLPEMVSLLS